MSNEMDGVFRNVTHSWPETAAILEKMIDVARPGAVFSEPVTAHDRTVITASEVSVSMGVGYGGGSDLKESADADAPFASGEGGGGGGYAAGRPVAAIIIDENGVRWEPIVDVTKLGLAFFTMLGSMIFLLVRMARARR